MAGYGVTPKGVVKKRFDEIMNELHDDLSAGWGVNTRLNPKSYLNVQLTAFADKIAELWEFGEDVYHSMYPFSAEGASLDNAVQYGGIAREDARPTYYPIHCECVDGTMIRKGTLIKSNTNPAIQFSANTDTVISRSSFNIAKIRLAAFELGSMYTVALNGALYSYTSAGGDTPIDIINGIAAAITDIDFKIDIENNVICLSSLVIQKSHELVLSGNLTTESVTGIAVFASEYNGEVILPDGTINQITTTVPGLLSVNNIIKPISGRLRQTDVGLRKSYADKIFHRSNRMLESVKSAILLNVQGVNAVACYQNDMDIIDEDGRWPHCVEVVADGGSDYEIALQIWDKKTDGIQTFGNTEMTVPGDEGEHIIIRFNRPEYVYVWYRITITMNQKESLPVNYAEAIKNIILEEMSVIEPGKPIVPQKMIDSKIYGSVPGIAYIDTSTFYSEDPSEQPDEYENGMVAISPRQRAVTEETRIEVLLGG